MAFHAGCDESVNDSGESSEATVCNTVGTTWWNQGFSDQTGTFHVEFAATPSADNIDAVIGLSNGSASAWTKLAAIVRFNPDGFIDARAGSEYKAVQQLRYGPGTYFIRIDVDVRRHTYSAWASGYQGSYGSWNQVAADYPFRTEQASVTKLNNISGFVNPQTGPAGTVQVCGFALNPTPTTANGCEATNAGGGFRNVAVAPGVNSMIVDVGGAPSILNMDGVIGVASGTVDEYNDLAASLRFYTNGRVEARDGDAYRADVALTYAPGEQFSFKFVIDLANKTYSVFAYPQGGDVRPVALATNYRFRTQQLGVTSLDHVASIVASSTGRVDVCDPRSIVQPNLRYARVGAPALAPFEGGLFVTEGATTRKLDANGKVVASLSVGGVPAVDATGNLYLARMVDSTTGVVEAYSPALTRLWSALYADDEGSIESLAAVDDRVYLVYRLATGYVRITGFSREFPGERGIVDVLDPGTVVAVSTGGYATAHSEYNTDGSVERVTIESHAPHGELRWSREFARTGSGSFFVNSLAIAPDGSVVFGGEFWGNDVSFGDRTFFPIGGGEECCFNAYFVALGPTGELRYSAQTGGSAIQDLETNGTLIAVSNFHFTQFPWVHFAVYDNAGATVTGCTECDVGLGHQGYAGAIALGTNRVYLNVEEHLWWEANRIRFPFTLAFDF